jgi:magnesium-transporting ATPase (P-type)
MVPTTRRRGRRNRFAPGTLVAIAGGGLVLGGLSSVTISSSSEAPPQIQDARSLCSTSHARREMTVLLDRVPKTAVRHGRDGLAEVPIEALVPGDRILIRQGEVVPVDGIVGAGSAMLDLSALTGESVPLSRKAGADVLSGSTNVGDAREGLLERVDRNPRRPRDSSPAFGASSRSPANALRSAR